MTKPQHIAIVMDGNGRWATQRGEPRSNGHIEGVKTMKACIDYAAKLSLQYLSFFAFSTENNSRSADEVDGIMRLVSLFSKEQMDDYVARNIRLVYIGSRKDIPNEVVSDMDELEQATAKCTGLTVAIAVGYGGQQDIIHAANALAATGEEITLASFKRALYTSDLPPIDLFIRTGGERRISNYMLFDMAYSELYFSDTLWPNFGVAELENAMEWFAGRTRRFGK